MDKEFLDMIVADFQTSFKQTSNRQASINRAGSCALVTLIIDQKLYIINVGDSRAVASLRNGAEQLALTVDHKPTEKTE